jgi:hypothetical protein
MFSQPRRDAVATAWAIHQAGVFDTPIARTLPARTSPSSVDSVSSNGVCRSHWCIQ